MNLKMNLKKSFDGFSLDVNLSVQEDLLVLFGPSGAGKSLILKMVSGIVVPDEGVVEIGDERVFDSENHINIPVRDRRIGYLFQDYALFPHMTVYQNIAYGINQLERPLVQIKVDELIEVMRLSGLEKRYPHELSGGQKQRCALARTLAIGPREEVFYRPKTRSVAKFIGTRNIFDGTVVDSDGSHVTILNQDIGVVKTFATEGTKLEKGQKVSFCIRPEEVLIIRPDRPLDHRVQYNIIEGEIVSITGKGSTQIMFLKTGSGDTLLKIELPNFVIRKLSLDKGRRIRVSLKKESLW